jgi:UDP-N-acetylglucosamine acyltransferase
MDVAPYCMVSGSRAELAGLNVIGMQRGGMTDDQIGRVKQAYKVVFRSNLGLAEAIAQLASELNGYPEVDHLVDFLEGSQRGITR